MLLLPFGICGVLLLGGILLWYLPGQLAEVLLVPSEGVPHRHCLEKDDMVQMILQTHKSGAVARAAAAPKAAKIPDRPPPCDLSRWRHMALFLKAEAGEAAEGRSPAVTAAFKAAVEAARENDDELYGCLCAWNAVKAIVDGSSSWVVGDVIQLLDYAAAAEIKCKAWKGYELMIQPRIKVLKKPLRDKIQVSQSPGWSQLCDCTCYSTTMCELSSEKSKGSGSVAQQ